MTKSEIQLSSIHNERPFMADANFKSNGTKKPVIIFNHGFKGFKDWGPFNLVAEKFAIAGFVFVKMNFSHNGVTLEKPNEFADLEAFARNNFCVELDDTGVLIDHLCSDDCEIPKEEMNLDSLYILGHSRGGASAILKANEDRRIKALATWAAVNNLETWHSEEEIEYWKSKGRIFIHNSRTEQEMPMDFQLVENFLENKERLQVPEAIENMKVPMFSVHGDRDLTVPVQSVKEISAWNPLAEIKIIEGADHTFGGGHPYDSPALPGDLDEVAKFTIDFFHRLDHQ